MPFKKKSKLNFISPQILRSIYLIKLNPIHSFSERRIFARSSKIPNLFTNKEILVHKGNSFKVKKINR